MRVLVIVAGLVMFLVGLGVYISRVYTDTSVQMVDNIERAERAVLKGDWEKAGEAIGETSRNWEKHKRWWALFIHHQEIDNIDTALTRTEKYIELRDSALATGELAVLKLLLQHIPEKERVQLKNVF